MRNKRYVQKKWASFSHQGWNDLQSKKKRDLRESKATISASSTTTSPMSIEALEVAAAMSIVVASAVRNSTTSLISSEAQETVQHEQEQHQLSEQHTLQHLVDYSMDAYALKTISMDQDISSCAPIPDGRRLWTTSSIDTNLFALHEHSSMYNDDVSTTDDEHQSVNVESTTR